jgi:hypothetical protein
LAYGYHPTLPSNLPLRPPGDPLHVSVRRLSDAIASASQHLHRAQTSQARHYDRHHRDLQFNVNDQVLLSTANLKIAGRPYSKLGPLYIGPFPVTERLGPVTYRLRLPPALPIHPVFHVNLLKPYAQRPSSASVVAAPRTSLPNRGTDVTGPAAPAPAGTTGAPPTARPHQGEAGSRIPEERPRAAAELRSHSRTSAPSPAVARRRPGNGEPEPPPAGPRGPMPPPAVPPARTGG